jgi:hypothetical protein
MAPTTNDRDDEIAAAVELNRLAEEIKDALTRADTPGWERLDYYRSAGEGLTKAKELCPHGTWEDWLKENFKLRDRQAQKYMAFAKAPRKALLEEEREAWRKASGAPKKGQTKKQKESAAVPYDGSRDFIPTLTKEEAADVVPMLELLMEKRSYKTAKELVLALIREAYVYAAADAGEPKAEGGPCLKQSA